MTGRRSYLSIRLPSTSNYENEINYQQHHMSVIVPTKNLSKIEEEPVTVQYGKHPMAVRFQKQQQLQMPINITAQPQRSSSLLVSAPVGSLHHRVQYFSVEFQIKPLSERGLLMYFGAFDDNLDRSLGFVSLSLQGGVVEFRISGPNNRVQVVRSVRMLAIGEWHKIKFTQSGRRLTLWVEGSAAAALATTGEVLISKEALVYFGGLPDLSRLPHNAISGFPVPFRGCIRQLIISGARIVLNETNILGKPLLFYIC